MNLSKMYNKLMNARQYSDYGEDSEFTKEEVEEYLVQAKEFNKVVASLIDDKISGI